VEAGLARRALGDVLAVCSHARPISAARWTAALATHLSECMRCASLRPADRSWVEAGARFRTSTGAIVSLPGSYSSGAREMYCRNVYLRSGLRMPTSGWVIDLGANQGLFSVWAALTGAQVTAVEAQHGFAAEICRLAEHNGVTDRVNVEVAMAGGVAMSGAAVGDLADDQVWSGASHAASVRPPDVSIPQLMSTYRIDRVGLMKMDIEGGEFAVFAPGEDLRWLARVDQLVLEVHHGHGDVPGLLKLLRDSGFVIDLRENNGGVAPQGSDQLNYAYCHRR
jgi:FkbM family methyltransferase